MRKIICCAAALTALGLGLLTGAAPASADVDATTSSRVEVAHDHGDCGLLDVVANVWAGVHI